MPSPLSRVFSRLTISLLPLGLLASAAQAEGLEIAPNLKLSGEFVLQHVKLGSAEQTDATADLRLSWRPVTDTTFSFGLEASLDGFIGLADDKNEIGVWAAAVFGFNGVDLKVGAPRPMGDEMALLPDFGFYGYNSLYYQTFLTTPVLGIGRGVEKLQPGISVQSNSEGPLSWGISAHNIGRDILIMSDDSFIYEAVGQYRQGDFTFSALVVHADEDIWDHVQVGARYDNGPWVLGGTYGRMEELGVRAAASRLYASYNFGNGLSVLGDALRFENLSTDSAVTYVTLGLHYEFANGLYLEAGTEQADGRSTFNTLSVGYKF